MSATTPAPAQFDLPEAADTHGLGQAARDYFNRVKGGDLGALPAVLGVVVLVAIFGFLEGDTFLSTANFANLINQGAAIIVLAMGLVFVLLLGEIDLSAGFTAGTAADAGAVVAHRLAESPGVGGLGEVELGGRSRRSAHATPPALARAASGCRPMSPERPAVINSTICPCETSLAPTWAAIWPR